MTEAPSKVKLVGLVPRSGASRLMASPRMQRGVALGATATRALVKDLGCERVRILHDPELQQPRSTLKSIRKHFPGGELGFTIQDDLCNQCVVLDTAVTPIEELLTGFERIIVIADGQGVVHFVGANLLL